MGYKAETNKILESFNPNTVAVFEGVWGQGCFPVLGSGHYKGPFVTKADYNTLFDLYKRAELELSTIGIQLGYGPYATQPDARTGKHQLAVTKD